MKRSDKQLPSKTAINLVVQERTGRDVSRVASGVLIILSLVLLFGKFAVADRFLALSLQRSELEALVAQNKQLMTQTADFEKLSAEYAKYSFGWMTDKEKVLYDRMDAIALVERECMNAATISRFSLIDNRLSVDFTDATLGTASQLVSRIQGLPQVASVEVYTANNQDDAGKTVSLSLTVQFKNLVEEGGESQ